MWERRDGGEGGGGENERRYHEANAADNPFGEWREGGLLRFACFLVCFVLLFLCSIVCLLA